MKKEDEQYDPIGRFIISVGLSVMALTIFMLGTIIFPFMAIYYTLCSTFNEEDFNDFREIFKDLINK